MRYLPIYCSSIRSPVLLSVEQALSKLERLLSKAEARSLEALDRSIAEALEVITREDAGGVDHCGYGVAPAQAC